MAQVRDRQWIRYDQYSTMQVANERGFECNSEESRSQAVVCIRCGMAIEPFESGGLG